MSCVLPQPVGCDGELYSSKTVDRCGVCGGNGTSCQRVSGSYRKALTQLGNTHTQTHAPCVCDYTALTAYVGAILWVLVVVQTLLSGAKAARWFLSISIIVPIMT